MRLHILSDLHLEFASYTPPQVDCDAVILAGDTQPGLKGVQWAMQAFPNREVIYILGNHEYYGQAYPRHVEKLKEQALGTRIHVLENDVLCMADIVFLGCTLWTDFKLLGDPRVAGFFATENMNDYHRIRVSPYYHKLRSLDTAGLHFRSVNWLENQVNQQRGAKIVVVTHHAPSARSLPPDYAKDILYAAYASNMDDFVKQSGAELWIHGHIHKSRDYLIGSTRVICNPRGRKDETITGFIPGMVVDI
jgi:predicted phosphodiesterase